MGYFHEESKELAEEITQYSLTELSENAANEVRGAAVLNELMIAMSNFEKAFDDFYNVKIQKRRLKAQGANYIHVKEEMQRLEKIAYESFFIFQNLFNEYYEQIIQMTFVNRLPNGSFELVLFDNNMKHIKENEFGSLEYEMGEISKIFKYELDEYNPTLLDETANEVYYRWDCAKIKANKGRRPILWNINGVWQGRTVNNKGTIAEAYANFYINKITFNGNIESRVGFYVTDSEHGMQSVDNTMGFILGDISAGNVQFAIKTNRASPMGMYRVRQFISKIRKQLGQTSTSEELVEELKKEVSQQGKAKQVQDNLSGSLDETFSALIKEYDKNK